MTGSVGEINVQQNGAVEFAAARSGKFGFDVCVDGTMGATECKESQHPTASARSIRQSPDDELHSWIDPTRHLPKPHAPRGLVRFENCLESSKEVAAHAGAAIPDHLSQQGGA